MQLTGHYIDLHGELEYKMRESCLTGTQRRVLHLECGAGCGSNLCLWGNGIPYSELNKCLKQLILDITEGGIGS